MRIASLRALVHSCMIRRGNGSVASIEGYVYEDVNNFANELEPSRRAPLVCALTNFVRVEGPARRDALEAIHKALEALEQDNGTNG